MSDIEFELFNKALPLLDQEVEDNELQEGVCNHNNTIQEKEACICTDCGQEINRKIGNTKEWRYYGQSDSKHNSDPNRVQMRKMDDRSIYKDVENLGFSETIVSKGNKIYSEVTDGKIYRGNSRRSIVFACIFHAYKLSGKPQSHERLIRIFNISRKTGLRGLKIVNLDAPKDSMIRTTYITPINLVEEIMEQFSASPEQKKEVVDIYNQIKNKSSRLNRSRPQSVGAGIVYYWIRMKNKDISLSDFAQKVALSKLTIEKIAKEIADILGTPHII